MGKALRIAPFGAFLGDTVILDRTLNKVVGIHANSQTTGWSSKGNHIFGGLRILAALANVCTSVVYHIVSKMNRLVTPYSIYEHRS